MRRINITCPACGSKAYLRPASVVYGDKAPDPDAKYYVCGRYPACDCYVAAHRKTMLPMGTLADKALRKKRHDAHVALDSLWKNGVMSRKEAYRLLQLSIQRRFQRLILRGLHIASSRSLRLFHRRGKIGNGLVVLSGQKYLRLINGDLVCDLQPVQQHFSIGAGQSEPEPLIARLQLDSAVGVSFQKAQRVKALHPTKLLHGRNRLGQHNSFSGHGLILPS